MKRISFQFILVFLSLWSSLVGVGFAAAQIQTVRPGLNSPFSRVLDAKQEKYVGKTIVSIEILTGSSGLVLKLNQWRTVFQKLGVSVRVRQVVLNEKPETRERKQGPLRFVKVVGWLDRSGKLIFASHSFSLDEGEKLKEWIDELKAYGAEGSPEGKPAWGLTKTVFIAINKTLSEPVNDETSGLPLETAIAKLELSKQYPLRFSLDARNRLGELTVQKRSVHQNVKTLSKGTSLAILLREQGFGFRPLRTPSGSIELVVEPFSKTTDLWPVGWPLPETLPRFKAFPSLFKITPIEFKDLQLTDLLDSVSAKTGHMIILDRDHLMQKGIDADKLLVSFPYRKISWALMLRRVTAPHHLRREYRLDERGRPFIWITTLELRASRK
ncbi:MAG: hypothetical protein IH899_07240 [Planctomycetes bacterium]|nr:hypothetical protein [Planctomycetota bacterium]